MALDASAKKLQSTLKSVGINISSKDMSSALKKVNKPSSSGSNSSGGSSSNKTQLDNLSNQVYNGKRLADMTVAEAAKAGKTSEYNQIVSGYFPGGVVKPLETGISGKTYAQLNTKEVEQLRSQISQGTPLNVAEAQVKPVTLPVAPQYPQITPVAPVLPETTQEDGSMTQNAQMIAEYLGGAEPTPINRQKLEKQVGLTDIKQRVNSLASQIGGLQAQNQADILNIRNQSSAEGGTAGILSAREDAVNRSYASKILPLNAQYQSELGNQQLAQEMVNTYIADENAYQDRLYAYKKDIGSMMYSAMNADQQRRWDLADQSNADYRDGVKQNNAWKQQAWQEATNNGQYSLASRILGLDATSSTFMTELGNYTGLISTPTPVSATQTTQQDITKINTLNDKVNAIDTLTADPYLSSAVGPNALGRISLSSFVTGGKQNFIAGVENLISQETLNSLINLKSQGGTLGALSDQERLMLQNSASKIGNWAIRDKEGRVTGYNTSEESFKTELNRLKELAQRAITNSAGSTGGDPLGLGVGANDPLNLGI